QQRVAGEVRRLRSDGQEGEIHCVTPALALSVTAAPAPTPSIRYTEEPGECCGSHTTWSGFVVGATGRVMCPPGPLTVRRKSIPTPSFAVYRMLGEIGRAHV